LIDFGALALLKKMLDLLGIKMVTPFGFSQILLDDVFYVEGCSRRSFTFRVGTIS